MVSETGSSIELTMCSKATVTTVANVKEDVVQVAMRLAGFSWAEGDRLRKVITMNPAARILRASTRVIRNTTSGITASADNYCATSVTTLTLTAAGSYVRNSDELVGWPTLIWNCARPDSRPSATRCTSAL